MTYFRYVIFSPVLWRMYRYVSMYSITVGEELRRIGEKVVWAFKDDFDNNIYIEEFIVNIIYLGMLLFCNIPRHFIGYVNKGLPWWLRCKESACNGGDLGLIPGLGRSPGEGNGTPLQYSCLENSTNSGAWWAIVHGVSESRTQLSD